MEVDQLARIKIAQAALWSLANEKVDVRLFEPGPITATEHHFVFIYVTQRAVFGEQLPQTGPVSAIELRVQPPPGQVPVGKVLRAVQQPLPASWQSGPASITTTLWSRVQPQLSDPC